MTSDHSRRGGGVEVDATRGGVEADPSRGGVEVDPSRGGVEVDASRGGVEVIRAADLVAADPTPGMLRQAGVVASPLWAGLVHTQPGAASGWHHHGEHETALFIVNGRMRLDVDDAGLSSVEAAAGDFVRVPPHVVHRESNPGAETSTAVIARAGSGPVTINVEGPA